MPKLEEKIAGLIRQIENKTGRFLTLGAVESATGGRIADRLTNIPGSSDYFKGSIVTYSNELKQNIASVKADTLNTCGAVSRETAIEMAEGGRKMLHVDICISTTGIAGPGGATPVKPVGLFYIGLATQDSVIAHKHVFHGSREDIKQKAMVSSFKLITEYLEANLKQIPTVPLEEKEVVTCFLEHQDMILILRRSSKVGTYRRAWAGVSGYLETEPLDQAYTEISEETGLFKNNIKLIKAAQTIDIIDNNLHCKWKIHPFLFHVSDPERIEIDWEHTEFRWIKPKDLTKYQTVPGLKKTLDSVLD